MTLPTLAARTLAAGTTLTSRLPGSSTTTTDPISYTVSVSNWQIDQCGSSSPQLTTTVPTGNPSLQVTVNDQDDNIQGTDGFPIGEDLVPTAVSEIESLITSGFYSSNATSFYRVVNDPTDNFVIARGGADANASTTYWDDELNQSLQVHQRRRPGHGQRRPDTNGSEFFISGDATQYLDYRYTVFGFLTEGSSILNQIIALQEKQRLSPNSGDLTNTVTITGVQHHHQQPGRRAAALGAGRHDGFGHRDGDGHGHRSPAQTAATVVPGDCPRGNVIEPTSIRRSSTGPSAPSRPPPTPAPP